MAGWQVGRDGGSGILSALPAPVFGILNFEAANRQAWCTNPYASFDGSKAASNVEQIDA